MDTPIKIILADDHQMFVDGLRHLLSTEPGYEVVGVAFNGGQALNLLRQRQADLLILDINMPELNGIEVTKQVQKQFPGVKVLILSMYKESNFARELLRHGARGYLIKNASKEELLKAISVVGAGGTFVSQEVTGSKGHVEELQDDFVKKHSLTEREVEILKLLVQQKTTAEIAEVLCRSIFTVDTHRKNLLKKLGLKNTAGLVRFTIENDIYSPS